LPAAARRKSNVTATGKAAIPIACLSFCYYINCDIFKFKMYKAMNFLLLLPTEIVIQKKIDKLIIEDAFGSFCILPEHADITTILAKGIVIIYEQGNKCYLALDGGYLVKEDKTVYISAESVILGENFKALARDCQKRVKTTNKKKYKVKSFLAKLEADFEKQLTEITKETKT
jgi:alternate F1F0 ATPase F1 subunit epsilon